MGLALVAMAEDLGRDMAYRSLEHLLQYGEPHVRRGLVEGPRCRWHQAATFAYRSCQAGARVCSITAAFVDHERQVAQGLKTAIRGSFSLILTG